MAAREHALNVVKKVTCHESVLKAVVAQEQDVAQEPVLNAEKRVIFRETALKPEAAVVLEKVGEHECIL